MHPEIIDTNQGEPAQQAGLKPRDVIMAVNGERDVSRERVIELIRAHEGKPLTLEMLRGGQTDAHHGHAAQDRERRAHRRADQRLADSHGRARPDRGAAR